MWYHVPKVLRIKWKHSLRLLICDRPETFSKVDNYCQSYLHRRNLLYCKTASKINLKEIYFHKFSASQFFLLAYKDVKPAWFIFFFINLQAADITGGVYLKVPQPLALLQYLLVSARGTSSRQCHRATCIVDTKSCTDLGNLCATRD